MTWSKCLLLAGCLFLTACSSPTPPVVFVGGTVTPDINVTITAAATTTATIAPTASATPDPTVTPLPTPSNLAARVNGVEITLTDLNAEVLRYVTADPNTPDIDSLEGMQLVEQMTATVLDGMIDQVLLEQDARRVGITVTQQQIDDEVTLLVYLRGGRDAFGNWLKANRQTEQDARLKIERELTASAMRDHILEGLPRTAEYVHAYHIVVRTQIEADGVLARLINGTRFTALAQTLSIDSSTRPDGGDLGWFTRDTGVVLWPEVEEAAFALKPGQVSAVVASPIGFHIVKVVDRQMRALTPNDTATLQQVALTQWIAKLHSQATIEMLLLQ